MMIDGTTEVYNNNGWLLSPKQLAGKADGRVISEIVKKLLA
jgi:hypothetical protein